MRPPKKRDLDEDLESKKPLKEQKVDFRSWCIALLVSGTGPRPAGQLAWDILLMGSQVPTYPFNWITGAYISPSPHANGAKRCQNDAKTMQKIKKCWC